MQTIKEKAIILCLHNGEQLVLKNETMTDKDLIINQILEHMPYCEIMEATILTNKVETHSIVIGVVPDNSKYIDELMPDDSQYKEDGEWQPYTSNNR